VTVGVSFGGRGRAWDGNLTAIGFESVRIANDESFNVKDIFEMVRMGNLKLESLHLRDIQAPPAAP
jgi:hypothetical protein